MEAADRPDQIEKLLAEVKAGKPGAMERLTETFYDQLRTMAEQHLRGRFGQAVASLTWQPTVLVHETLLRILKQRQHYDSDGHFFAIATLVMKRVLLDYSRHRRAQKRGGGGLRIEFDPTHHSPAVSEEASGLEVEALLEAVDRLAQLDARKADVTRMRLLWGLSIEETAESLGVGRSTVERDWRFAKAWLRRELKADPPGQP